MGKKLTDANKWKSERWFRHLPPYYKLAWEYIHGVCDTDGTWPINCLDLVDDLKIPDDFDLLDFVKVCNKDFENLTGKIIERQRIMLIGHDYLWLTGYIQLQQESSELKVIKADSNFARSALMKLASKGALWEGLRRGFIALSNPLQAPSNPLPSPCEGALYIVVDKEIDKEIIGTMYSRELGDSKGGKGGKKGGKVLSLVGDQPSGVPPGNQPSGLPAPTPPPPMTAEKFKEFEETMIHEEIFIHPVMASSGIRTDKELRLWIQTFHAHIVGNEEIKKDYSLYRKHFKNWIKTQDCSVMPKAINGKGKLAGGQPIPTVTQDQLKQYDKPKH